MSELFTVTVDDRQVEVPKGTGPRRSGAGRRDRDPGVLLRAASRASGRRVPHVPRRDRRDAEAPGRLHAHGDGRDGHQDERDVGESGGGAGGDARVHPREPPARLPRLRQGRRVPAAGPHVPPRAGQHAHVVREAHRRQADPGLAAHRARPRALHPLLPLHAILRRRRRGRPAHRAESRSAHGDRDVRGRAVPLALLRQRRRALPRRRTHLDPVPLRRAALGHPERADRLRGLRGRLQHVGTIREGKVRRILPEPSRGRSRLALRQGPLLLPAPASRGPDNDAAAAGNEGARGDLLGRCARRGRDDAARVRRIDRHRILGLGDHRDRLRARAPAARRRGRPFGRAPRGHVERARGVPASAERNRRGGDRGRGRRRSRRRARAHRRPLDQRSAEAWAEIVIFSPAGTEKVAPGSAAEVCRSWRPDAVRSRRGSPPRSA